MSAPRPTARRVLALGAVWALISGAALAAPGCYGRNCEGSTEVFGAEPGQGRMLDEDTWASGPLEGTWLFFPRQRYYVFDIRALGGRMPKSIEPYVSASPEPTKNGGNFTPASGNLAKLFSVAPNRVDVFNDSCTDYYLHLVVEVPPLPPAAPGVDAGAEEPDAAAEAGAGDEDDAGVGDGGDGDGDAGP